MFDSKKISILEERLKGVTQLLWLATRRNGGNMSFTNAELDEVPGGAQLKFHNVDDGLEIISTLGKPVPTSTDITVENGKVD